MNALEKRFENVEDMTNWLLAHAPRKDTRWKLEYRTDNEWDDPEAGKKWNEEYYGLGWVPHGSEGHEEYEAKREELQSRRPAEHRVEIWSLSQSSNSWRSEYIYLSVELGKLLDRVWTKREPYRGASYTVNSGSLSVPGMLKRLGKTDIGKRVKEAEKLAEETRQRNARNYARKQIREHAQAIITLMEKNPSIIVPSNLLHIVNENIFINEE